MNKTNKVMAGISSTALMLGLAGCGSSSDPYAAVDIPPAPEDQECTDWEWDLDDGVWECEDSNSGYYGHYYHGGKYYSSKSLLTKSKSYSSYKNSSTFKGISSTGSSGSSSKMSSGFGSGSKSFGG
ncbi:aminotransferase yhxA [Mesobacillus maritimus]|uniref:Aminotransferase yhxA n=1 Tax=Mesobacillus maritimus TaxID=1643336 RepID=A0ABS7K695_9BACI|nr:aminotransferase yhxA [Mesobacillus maritimus]